MNPLCLKGVAHRGLWVKDKVSENSLEAFKRAVEHNVAIELDIHLTKDGELIVIHDEDLKRLTGKEGIVEHLTLKELQENYRLLDGSVIPSFNEVLDVVNEQVPIFVELKVYEKNYKPLAAKAREVLDSRIKDKKNIVIISFDPRSLWPLKKAGYVRLLLVVHTHMYVYRLFGHTADGLDIEDVLFEKPCFRRYAKHHFMNVWTIEKEEQIKKVRPYVDTVTFQHMDPKEVEALLK